MLRLASYGIGWCSFMCWRLVGSMLAIVCMVASPVSAQQPGPEAQTARILVLGDSLTVGLGLPTELAFPRQLEKELREREYSVTVIDAGVSGDTTSSGLARLDWALTETPHLVIVELGANDGLRGIDPALTRRNLGGILERLSERSITVVLAGMYAPPNLGHLYTSAFNRIYPELARRYDVLFYPFFLEGVAGVPELNLEDGVHPNADGMSRIVAGILPTVIDGIHRTWDSP